MSKWFERYLEKPISIVSENQKVISINPLVNLEKPPLVCAFGPPGSGKTTFTTMITEMFPDSYYLDKSWTTRERQPRDIIYNYHYVSKEIFQELKKQNFFFETTDVYGNFYGADKKFMNNPKIPIFTVDWKGVESFRNKLTTHTPIVVFIIPESEKILLDRNHQRNTHNRLSLLDSEMEKIKYSNYILITGNSVPYEPIRQFHSTLLHSILELPSISGRYNFGP